MKIHIERGIAYKLYEQLPLIAKKDGIIVIKSNRGVLTIRSNGNTISYTYGFVHKEGNEYDLSREIADIAYYLLDTNDGTIGHIDQRQRIGYSSDNDNGYSLSGESMSTYLTSSTYDGGNSILSGGNDGYRSDTGSGRILGSEYD